MSFLTIDQEKCTRDGFCVQECPAGILAMNGNGPESIPEREAFCLKCGHCVAVCPHGALSLQTMPVEQCPPLRDAWTLTPEQVEHLLKGRRSIRRYQERPVERETLAQLIDVARFGPTGHNTQPVEWLVIHDTQEVQRIAGAVIDWMRTLAAENSPMGAVLGARGLVAAWDAGADPICRNAPHLIVTHAPQDNRMAPPACTIALTYLELAALPLHLGTCWAGFVHVATLMSPDALAALGLPEGYQCCGAMMVGYPKFSYHRIPLRNEARITWR
jgi:nitroreductase/NAD-dependent dihydropyrimidine dehydrogenase PreA subunit